MQYFFVFSFVFLFSSGGAAQMGCTDPLALNYDSSASQNDGSCVYATTTISPTLIAEFPSFIHECSGMVRYQEYLIAINDSGDDSNIYLLDPTTGEYIRTIFIENATNVDWESLAIYDGKLYIGDTGNNAGDREDLGIYRVPLDQLSEDVIEAEFYPFAYPDQVVFGSGVDMSPFDCEAIIIKENGAFLFTKGWNDGNVGVYHLDPTLTIITKVDSVNLGGLITGASIDENGVVGLTGFNGASVFWLLSDYSSTSFFSGNIRIVNFDFLGQNESIHLNDGKAWTSTEASFIGTANIYEFGYDDLVTGILEAFPDQIRFEIYPNPFVDKVIFTSTYLGRINIIDSQGKIVRRLDKKTISQTVDFAALSSGIYFIQLLDQHGAIIRDRVVK